MSVRPSVRADNDNRVRFFFVWKVYSANRNCQNARRFTKLEPNENFNDFAISREPFDEIDSNFFILKVF